MDPPVTSQLTWCIDCHCYCYCYCYCWLCVCKWFAEDEKTNSIWARANAACNAVDLGYSSAIHEMEATPCRSARHKGESMVHQDVGNKTGPYLWQSNDLHLFLCLNRLSLSYWRPWDGKVVSDCISYTLVPPHLQVSSAMFTSQAIHWPLLLLVQLLKIRTRLLFPMFVSS